jgi:V/A-type H+-transporting ATPase subunit I
MKTVKVFGNIEVLDSFIRHCCLNGTFEPEDAMNLAGDLEGYTSMVKDNPYTSDVQMIEELSKEFSVPLNPHKYTKFTPISENAREYFLYLRSTLKENFDTRNELKKQFELNSAAIENYRHFLDIDVNIKDLLDSEFTKARFGYLPKKSYDKLVYNIYADIPFAIFLKGKEVRHGYWGVYFSPADKVKEVDAVFKELSFQKAYVPPFDGDANDAVSYLEKDNERIEQKIKDLTEEIETFIEQEQEHYNDLYGHLLLLESGINLRQKAAVNEQTGHFLYTGWLEASEEKDFLKQTKYIKGIMVEIEDPTDISPEDVPIKLKNNILFRPFEFFVNMFGLPKYNELDPTPFFALTYFIMFGLMFADVGQGLVVIIAGILMWKFKKMGVGPILTRCGISSCIFGFFFGSVFGFEDLLDPLFEKVGITFLPLHPFENTTTVLIFAIAIGIAFIYLVIGLNIYGNIKTKNYVDVFFTANGVAGLLAYTGCVLAVIEFMGKKTFISSWILALLICVGILMLFMHKYLSEKVKDKNYKTKIIPYIFSSFIDVFEELLSFFSNTVSYLRLGAFVLVHAGMMMVVSAMAGLTSSLVVQIIIYVLGNALVITLEALLTAIQALRLEYYEMFSRFYSGEGRPFKPAQRYVEK